MAIYFSTFISGLSDFIVNQITADIKPLTINLITDGLIEFQTENSIDITNINYFNNSYQLIEKLDSFSLNDNHDSLLNHLITSPLLVKYFKKKQFKAGLTFRLVISKQNQMITANQTNLNKLENKISHLSHLQVNRQLPDLEFWLMIRTDGLRYFGLRLTKIKKHLNQGELRPELAYILNLMSNPNSQDIVLDPFMGSGAIIKQRLTMPFSKIIASDIDPTLVNLLQKQIRHPNVLITKQDALSLSKIKNQSIDKIITDPPWGLYQPTITDIADFYSQFLNQFYRILTTPGQIVLLTAQKDIVDNILHSPKNQFSVVKKYDILVNGKKSAIYILHKT